MTDTALTAAPSDERLALLIATTPNDATQLVTIFADAYLSILSELQSLRMARSSTSSGDVGAKVADLDDYDAGLLNVYGGGDTDWWLDYIRAEIGRANDFWREQISALSTPALAPQPSSGAKPCKWGGGNDYLACRTCGLEYDYRKEDQPSCPRISHPSSASVGGVSEAVGWETPKTRKYVILRKPAEIDDPVEAYGVYLNDGRFMDIASNVEQDAIDMAEVHYETDEYHIRPLYAMPRSAPAAQLR